MSDLAPRPRGGWQVGTHFGRRDQRGQYSAEHPDPSPDCYGVEWLDAQGATASRWTAPTLLVRHYRHVDDDTPCCVREVTRRPGESHLEMLARVYPPFALCARGVNEVGRSVGGGTGNRPADPAGGVLHRPADDQQQETGT